VTGLSDRDILLDMSSRLGAIEATLVDIKEGFRSHDRRLGSVEDAHTNLRILGALAGAVLFGKEQISHLFAALIR
jgi:hypothetical protein